jgi:hypothetical protein
MAAKFGSASGNRSTRGHACVNFKMRHYQALEAVDIGLRGLEDRMTHLEDVQGQIVVEARSAASAAAITVSGAIISDVVTRVIRVEIRAEEAAKRLPSASVT